MSARSSANSVPVYSSEQGRLCPKCRKPAERCACAKAKAAPKGDGVVRVSRQTKGRGGKAVCVVTGLGLPEAELEKLARDLKKRLGTGGAVKDGAVEIQGDRREAVLEALAALGIKAKAAGG